MTLAPLQLLPARRWSFTHAASVALTLLAAGALLLMVVLFAVQSIPAWRHEGIGYLTGRQWFYRGERFGVLPMIYGAVVVSAIAMLIAAPVGIGAAVFSAELVPTRLRMPIKIAIELLAGIPSVVYGLLGILVLRNHVYDGLHAMGFDPLSGDTLLTAGVLLAIMLLPTVMTLSDDALRGVPRLQRDAARGLGLTQGQVILSVVIPQAWQGLAAAVLLALGRALGEMIAVYLVIGRRDNQLPDHPLSLKPLIESGQTLSTKLGGAEINLAYGDPLHWGAMVGLALVLLLLVATVTLAGAWLSRRSRGGDA